LEKGCVICWVEHRLSLSKYENSQSGAAKRCNLFSISFRQMKVNCILLKCWRASWDSYDGRFSIHSMNGDSTPSVCHCDYNKKRCTQDCQFFIGGWMVYKNIKFNLVMHKSITWFGHSLTKRTFHLTENGNGPSFSSHPKHSIDREGLMHIVYLETAWLKLFHVIRVL
jgi:hypothetical protein